MLTAVLTLVLGALILYLALKPSKQKGTPVPGPPSWPIVGIGFKTSVESLRQVIEQYMDTYGELFRLNILGSNIVVLNSADTIQKAFAGDPAKFVMNDRGPIYISRFFPEKSILLHESGFSNEHNMLRKGFTKGFHIYGDGIKVFEETVQKAIQTLLNTVEEYKGQEFDCNLVIRNSIISLISVFMNGQELTPEDPRTDAIYKYISAVGGGTRFWINILLTKVPIARFVPGPCRDVHNTMRDNLQFIIQEYFTKQKASYVEDSNRGIVDFLLSEQLRESQSVSADDMLYTDGRIQGIIGDIMLGGVITTVSSITSMLLCMIRNPDVQKRVQAEIHEVVGTDRLPSLEDKARCTYTEAVFLETQRYISVAPLGGAHLCKAEAEFEGFHVPANTKIMANLWHVHHDEKVWGDPWTFRPERFLDEDGELLPRSHPFRKHWLAFGIGRRQCIGETFARSRIFLYFAALMQKWTFLPVEGKCGSCDPRSDQFNNTGIVMPKPYFCKVVDSLDFTDTTSCKA